MTWRLDSGLGGGLAPGSFTETGGSPKPPSVAGPAQASGRCQRPRVGLSLWPGAMPGSAEGARSQDAHGSPAGGREPSPHGAAEVGAVHGALCRARPPLGALPGPCHDQT